MPTLDLKRTWDAALGDIQLQMTRATFDTWMKDTELVEYEDGLFVISTPSPYAVEWLANRLHRMIKQTLRASGRSERLAPFRRPHPWPREYGAPNIVAYQWQRRAGAPAPRIPETSPSGCATSPATDHPNHRKWICRDVRNPQ